MKSFGLDLSLARTGWAMVTSQGLIDSGTIVTDKKTFAGPGELVRRIEVIKLRLLEILESDPPDSITIEGFAMGAQGRVFDLAELGGVIKNALYSKSFAGNKPTIFTCPPKSVKSFAGNGNADKKMMAQFALQNYSLTFKDDNICDAFYLALVGLCLSSNYFQNKMWTTKQEESAKKSDLVRPFSRFIPRSMKPVAISSCINPK